MSKSTRQIPTIPTSLPREGSNMTIYSHRRNGSVESRNFSQLLELGKKYYRANQMYQSTQILKRGLYYDPSNPELNYLLGAGYLVLENIPEAIKHLQLVAKNHPDYKGEVMMLLAIAHKRQGNLKSALQVINKQVKQQSNEDSLFFRAKINHKLTNLQEAIDDIDRLLLLNPQSMAAFMLKSKCLISQNEYQQALQNIKVAKSILTQGDKLQQLMLQEAKIYAKMKNIKEALKIIEKVQKQFPQVGPQCCIFKANLYQQTGKTQEAMMLYNQLLSKNSSPRVFCEALAQSAISCMRERDFYEAFAYLKRSQFMNVKSRATDQLLKLAQGVTFLMKKKYAQAIVLMGSCDLKFSHELECHMNFLTNLCNNALAFGNFSLGNHQTALELYGAIVPNEKSTDMTAVAYNISICEGILAHHKGNKEEALLTFEKATQAINRPEPFFYMAVILNQQYCQEPINTDGFVKVLQLIQKGLKVGQNAHMFYYRAILYLYLGMNNQALEDIDRAIEKSQDNVARYFHARGVIFFLDKNYQQAIMEFGTALSIDQHDETSMIEKAKCQLLQGQEEAAYKSLQGIEGYDEWILLFLLHEKQYGRVLEGEPGENIKQICYFMEGRFQEAGPSGKLMLAILYENYSEVINLIDEACGLTVTIGCLDNNDLLILKAFCQYRLGDFQEALLTLAKVQNFLKQTSARNETYSEEDQRKLLLCRVNIILLNFKREHQIQALTLAEELAGQICEGPIFDEINSLRTFLAEGGELQLELGFNSSMLSDYFAEEQYKGLKFKYFIPFPTYRVLEVQFPHYEQLLLNFTTKDIDNRPEAPWIKRGQYGLIFTNEVRQFQNLNLKTEENQAYRSRMPTNEQSRVMPHKRSQLIQNLKLSTSVLDKLERLAQKNNKND